MNLIWYSFARKNYLFLGNRKVRDTLANFSRERIYKREIHWIILFIPRFSVIEGIFFDNSPAMYRNFDLLYDILFFLLKKNFEKESKNYHGTNYTNYRTLLVIQRLHIIFHTKE